MASSDSGGQNPGHIPSHNQDPNSDPSVLRRCGRWPAHPGGRPPAASVRTCRCPGTLAALARQPLMSAATSAGNRPRLCQQQRRPWGGSHGQQLGTPCMSVRLQPQRSRRRRTSIRRRWAVAHPGTPGKLVGSQLCKNLTNARPVPAEQLHVGPPPTHMHVFSRALQRWRCMLSRSAPR